nr:molybdate ABC transporter substrate-binding protein [Paenibacillus puerhi]
MRLYRTALALALMLFLAVGCASQTQGERPSGEQGQETKQVELLISAAASLTDSMKAVEAAFAQMHPHIKLTFHYAASGTLQQQLEQGAPSDLFLSAGTKQMAALVDKQLIAAADQTNLLTNELVVIVAKDGQAAPGVVQDLAKPEIKKLSIGQPESVPAGSYAKESLVYHKLWDELQPRLVLAMDVRQVLSYVETGNVEAGYVYRTDALSSSKVRVAFAADRASYKPIEYPAGILKASAHPAEARVFYDFLQSPEARDIFISQGFSIPAK